jgi:hypothetical protein
MIRYFRALQFFVSTVVFLGSFTAQAAVITLQGKWVGNGTAYDPAGKQMFTYSVDEENTAVSFSETESITTVTLQDGSSTKLLLTYSDTSLYDYTITSEYGTGEGSCSSMWGPCKSSFGSDSHSFETTLYIDGINSSHLIKKEYVQGRLSVVYKESYGRTSY